MANRMLSDAEIAKFEGLKEIQADLLTSVFTTTSTDYSNIGLEVATLSGKYYKIDGCIVVYFSGVTKDGFKFRLSSSSYSSVQEVFVTAYARKDLDGTITVENERLTVSTSPTDYTFNNTIGEGSITIYISGFVASENTINAQLATLVSGESMSVAAGSYLSVTKLN